MNDEKAIEQLEEFLVIDDWSVVYMPYLHDAIEYVINRIKALEERPQGEWGKHGECPFCSYIRQWEDDKFCGNCGADMRKGGAE